MLSGWGRYPRIDCRMLKPRSEADLRSILVAESSLIARGNGRSYGDPALNSRATVTLHSMDRLLAFDSAIGVLEAEAGVMLSDIIDVFLPRGWFIPVTPGTKFVSLGGMIAADVHGKNHHKDGSLASHVESLRLMLADGRVVDCSRQDNRDLLEATCGGMGLTGVILSARLRLRKVDSAWIRQEAFRTRDLAETMDAFESSRDWTYSVAWIDCLASGPRLGRSLLYRGEHARIEELPSRCRAKPFDVPRRRTRKVSFDFPSLALNRWSVRAFNALYYALAKPGRAIVDYDTYFYPLDAIGDWNRIYGRSGFVQYQCVLPKDVSRRSLAEILGRIGRAGSGSFLSVLKLLGPGRGLLSFPLEGYTLALDFPVRPVTFAILRELDAIVTTYGGRLYLAKDARAAAATFRAGYSGLDEFEAVRRQVDPSHKFSSLQSERLNL